MQLARDYQEWREDVFEKENINVKDCADSVIAYLCIRGFLKEDTSINEKLT